MLAQNLEQTWLSLKAKGLYQNFKTYADYQEAQKKKGIVDLKPKVGMMNPVNPALAQIKADEKSFNDKFGIDQEIDVSKIPF